jgi:hypothetical protein
MRSSSRDMVFREDNVRIKLSVLSGLFALAVVVSPQISAAAMLSPHTMQLGIAASQQPSVQKIGRYKPYNRCRYWANECAANWGWNNWGYRRCMWRRGC